jgi:hypothetical protein
MRLLEEQKASVSLSALLLTPNQLIARFFEDALWSVSTAFCKAGGIDRKAK